MDCTLATEIYNMLSCRAPLEPIPCVPLLKSRFDFTSVKIGAHRRIVDRTSLHLLLFDSIHTPVRAADGGIFM